MYVIHLIVLLNILGVMIDNNRFVLYCISWQEQATFNEMMIMSFCTKPTLSWIFIVLAH